MTSNSLPIFKDISFNPNSFEEHVDMQALSPGVFDQFSENGWVPLADYLYRKNYATIQNKECRVIPLRIDLQRYKISKSQKKCIRRNSDLTIEMKKINILDEHINMFKRHSERIYYDSPPRIDVFLNSNSYKEPCTGLQFDFFDPRGRLICSSFFHIGTISLCANYCIYEPSEAHRSLGLFSMLKEIEYGLDVGLRYYYLGYTYDLPCQFEYKLNFEGLEYFDWWGNWHPLVRMPVRNWKQILKQNAETDKDKDTH